MNSSNLRILPLLIFVAMLAFSVRLADIFVGFSSLSGGARAESEEHGDEAAGHPDSMAKTEDHAAEDTKSGGLTFEQESSEHEEPDEAPDVDLPSVEDAYGQSDVEWRDATDTEITYSNVKNELKEDMAERRKILDKREKALVTREALLRAAEKELDRKYQELSQLSQKIEKLLEQQSEEEKARIQSLVKIYEGMKAKDAARIFDTLDIDVLISVMGQMSERKLSPILAEMNPDRARAVTIILVEEKQLPDLP